VNSHPPIIEGTLITLRRNKEWAESAIKQTSDKNMHKSLTPDTNSIVVVMKHIAGNLRSRWTDFLTSDGEKDWRNRDNEFIDEYKSREELMQDWESGWSSVFSALESLTDEDLEKSVLIRGEKLSVPLAIQRSLAHTAYHVGQIIILARALYDGDKWVTITIPRGGSSRYNESVWGTKDFRS
jgi:hypothetical protein